MQRRPEAEVEEVTSQTAGGRGWCPQRNVDTRFTCTGIGTTIFEPLLPATPTSGLPVPRDGSPDVGLEASWWWGWWWWGWCAAPAALTLFHLARRFWNQILTCISDRRSWKAICERSVSERYFLLSNSRSSSANCHTNHRIFTLDMGKNPHCLSSVLFGFYQISAFVRFAGSSQLRVRFGSSLVRFPSLLFTSPAVCESRLLMIFIHHRMAATIKVNTKRTRKQHLHV